MWYLSDEVRKEVFVEPLKLVTVKLPEKLVTDVDQLVRAGIYHNRSDAIRDAVRDLLKRQLWRTDQT
jgi:Arc/MetJ-type ribon-helix-helix transcriptional regulator